MSHRNYAVFSNRAGSLLWQLLTLALLLGAGATAQAESPFRVQVPVINHSEAELDRALQSGMASVLERLTSAPTNVSARQIVIRNASNYVAQMDYVRDSSAQSPLLLDVLFLRQAVEIDLQTDARVSNALPVPDVPVLWLAVVGPDNEAYIIGQQNRPKMVQALRGNARNASVALILPHMDAQDRNAINTQDLLSGSFDRIKVASGRYASSETLLGVLHSFDGQWSVDWTYDSGDQNRVHWQTQSHSAETAVVEGLIQLRQFSRGARENQHFLHLSMND